MVGEREACFDVVRIYISKSIHINVQFAFPAFLYHPNSVLLLSRNPLMTDLKKKLFSKSFLMSFLMTSLAAPPFKRVTHILSQNAGNYPQAD